MPPDAGWSWAASQGTLGVVAFVLTGAVVWLIKWVRDLYRERVAEIGVLRDALNETKQALENVREGMASIRGAVADVATIGSSCKIIAEDVQREAKALPHQLRDATDRIIDRVAAIDTRRERP